MPFTQREKYMIFFVAVFTLFLPLAPILFNSNATDFLKYVADLKDQWTNFFEPISYEEVPRNDADVRILSVVIGIELGRTYSRVGYFEREKFELITDEQGNNAVPSHVSFNKDGQPLVGFAAKDQAGQSPKSTVYDISLLAGKNFSDPETKDIIAGLAYDVVERDGKIVIKIPSKATHLYLSPAEIMAEILKKLKTIAEIHLNRTISSAIIAVPSPANEAQRQAAKDAGRVAGLAILHIWSEAEAAGIAYGIDTPLHPHPIREIDQFIIFQIEDKESKLALVATGYGGGVTAVISDSNLNGIDLEKGSWIGWWMMSPGTRACGLVKELLESAGMDKSQIEGLIITGNPEHVGSIQPSLETCLGKKARSLHSPSKRPVQSDEAIVRGMTMQGCHWSTPERECTWLPQGEWAALSLGIETSGGTFTPLISKYALLPTHRRSTFTTTRDSQDKVEIKIYEGERPLARKNRLLGTIELRNIPRKPRGELTIEVEFELNCSHRLIITVRERESGKEDRLDLMIEHSNEEPDEVEEAVKEAEKYREEDNVFLKMIKLKMEDGQGLGEFDIEAKEFPLPPPEIRRGWEWLFG